MSPNWRQIAALPDSRLKQSILKALDIELPPAGVSRSFQDGGLYITKVEGGFTFMDTTTRPLTQRNSAQLLATPSDVIRLARWPASTPTGEALRNWLVHWGHSRPVKGGPVSVAAATGFGPEAFGDESPSPPGRTERG